MENTLNQNSAVSMVVLPMAALDELRISISDLKEMVKGKALDEVSSQWLESEAARKFLGVSRQTWQTYRDARALPFSQFGRKIYVKRADLEAFLESHMVKNEHWMNSQKSNKL